MTKIAIIGVGALGSAIARKLVGIGVEVLIANSREPATLQALVEELGPKARAVTKVEAAQADIVFLAVNWNRVEDALKDLGPWNGRILVDANNAIKVPSFEPFDLGGQTSSQVLAEWAPGARVVKAFNHLGAPTLEADPKVDGGRRVLFLAGDDAEAKKSVTDVIAKMGYTPIDLGELDQGKHLQVPGGALSIINLVQLEN